MKIKKKELGENLFYYYYVNNKIIRGYVYHGLECYLSYAIGYYYHEKKERFLVKKLVGYED